MLRLSSTPANLRRACQRLVAAIFELSEREVFGGVLNAIDEQGNEVPNEPLMQLCYFKGNRLESVTFLPIDVSSRPLTAEELARRCELDQSAPVSRQAGGS